ncbi:PHO2 [Sanghuangporus sanghuang]
MEAKDSLFSIDSPPGFRNRAKLPHLSLDSSSKYGIGEDIALVTEDSSSSPSASMSPTTPGDVPLSALTDPQPDFPTKDDEKKEAATEPRSATATSSSSKSRTGQPREKRKRSRVTPEQLTHLERFFAADRSPTAARRKEISELLGMQERQTQIWFQNRRAKAKLLDGKKSRHLGNEWSDTPPDTPPQLSAGFEADLHGLIHEDHPISIIPCTDLSIGSWRRIATGKHDLVAYVCEAKRCLTWFIHSAGYGFKMEIPFEIITHTEFRNASPGEGLASFHLSQPPNFYLEHIASPRSAGGLGGGLVKMWKKCSDWTEGTQASQILRHDLVGSAVQLAHVLSDLREYRQRSSISLLSPSAYSSSDMLSASTSASPTTMQIPQPPFASLQSNTFSQRPSFMGHSRKRSNSGPPALTRMAPSSYIETTPSVSPVAESVTSHPYSAGYTSTSFNRPSQLSSYPYGQRVISDYMPGSMHTSFQQTIHEQSIPDYSSIPISHGASQRPFSSGPTTTQFFPTGERNTSPLQAGLRQSSTIQSPHGLTPSPPLISQPYGTDPSMGLQGLSYMGPGESQGQGSCSSPSHDQSSLAGRFGTASSSSDILSPPPPM